MSDDTITLTLRVEGETTIEVDRAEYEQAKADGEVDQMLDVYLSDLSGRKTVVEPDGREYNPRDEPHGPAAADDTDLRATGSPGLSPAPGVGPTGGGAGG